MSHGHPVSWETSVELLAGAQTSDGAIPASTVHEVYRYGWLRDGSWCAYALERAGRSEATAAWHHWVATTLLAHEDRVEEALAAVAAGRVDGQVMMPARFTLLRRGGRGPRRGRGGVAELPDGLLRLLALGPR